MADSDVYVAITQALSEYSDEVAEAVKEIVKEVADECVEDIKAKSPKKTGEYRKGWKAKVEYEDNDNIRIVVRNAKKPEITHLLEFGHAKVNGGRVEGHPHIKPAEEKAKKNLMQRITEALNNDN